MTENKEFWRSINQQLPEGRVEFYDQKSGAKGVMVIVNGNMSSVTLKEGPSGWAFYGWHSITHWRPDNKMVFNKQVS